MSRSTSSLRTAIVVMSAFAVISDAVLIAFYPQFFESRYGITSEFHVGAYIAAISIAVMFTLPLWARVARRVETMQLLLVTQCAAGLLCLASAFATTASSAGEMALSRVRRRGTVSVSRRMTSSCGVEAGKGSVPAMHSKRMQPRL